MNLKHNKPLIFSAASLFWEREHSREGKLIKCQYSCLTANDDFALNFNLSQFALASKRPCPLVEGSSLLVYFIDQRGLINPWPNRTSSADSKSHSALCLSANVKQGKKNSATGTTTALVIIKKQDCFWVSKNYALFGMLVSVEKYYHFLWSYFSITFFFSYISNHYSIFFIKNDEKYNSNTTLVTKHSKSTFNT